MFLKLVKNYSIKLKLLKKKFIKTSLLGKEFSYLDIPIDLIPLIISRQYVVIPSWNYMGTEM